MAQDTIMGYMAYGRACLESLSMGASAGSIRVMSWFDRVRATLRRMARHPAVRRGVLLFLVGRLVLGLWAAAVLALMPLPAEADEAVRPYVGAPRLQAGMAGAVLGPWQRFDTMRYLALARDGYSEQNSVFPPLYPLAIRGSGALLGAVTGWAEDTANLVGAILLANLALLASLILLYQMTVLEIGAEAATRTLVYLLFFPVGFFLFAGYTESLFLFFAMGAVWAARQDRPLVAGVLGLLAALTRLTGWGLVVPLAYAYLQRRDFSRHRLGWQGLAAFLPVAGVFLFFGWRSLAGFPPLGEVYRQYWYQSTGVPGSDLFVALKTIVTGTGPRAGEITLVFDLLVALLLVVTTVLAFRRLGALYGLYALMMLLFMLLPVSELKPLYSFSRYALAFFPSFMILGAAGRNPWLNRLILYPSIALYLYFSGQFFVWGWVA
mgnify:CR=1 FL=1